jgi:hypothetical protein
MFIVLIITIKTLPGFATVWGLELFGQSGLHSLDGLKHGG